MHNTRATNETEVFRLTPTVGNFYYTTEYTRKTGDFLSGNERYYTTKPLNYVGQFVKHCSHGFGDGATHWDIFMDNGEEVKLYYTYEGTTSFLEVDKSTVEIRKTQKNANPVSRFFCKLW
jgi:hypothetical protein